MEEQYLVDVQRVRVMSLVRRLLQYLVQVQRVRVVYLKQWPLQWIVKLVCSDLSPSVHFQLKAPTLNAGAPLESFAPPCHLLPAKCDPDLPVGQHGGTIHISVLPRILKSFTGEPQGLFAPCAGCPWGPTKMVMV